LYVESIILSTIGLFINVVLLEMYIVRHNKNVLKITYQLNIGKFHNI